MNLQHDLPLQAAFFRQRFTSVEPLRLFLEAGKAIVTVVSRVSGKRFTFRFSRRAEEPGKERPVWISVLTGADNESSYTFACSIWPVDFKQMRFSAKSRMSQEAPSMKALEWFLQVLYSDNPKNHALLFERTEIWHEGRCGRCGRKLTVPESIESGFGPECAGRMP